MADATDDSFDADGQWNGDTLPADVLHSIAQGGGRVVLVVGAGCSAEPPTSLPLASTCATNALRQLIADGILQPSDCGDPEDLSVVADAVFVATAGQHELVRRLPRSEFLLASPNEGYLLAAAMLREHAIGCVMTLNFDVAMSSALTQVGARDDVGVVAGPEQHSDLRAISLIYLHRNVHADPERWILRTSALTNDWRDRWEEVIAARVLASPVTIFVGLGTPAGVLVETTLRIRRALDSATTVQVYQVDPVDRDRSVFFAALGLANEAYIQMGWSEFMRRLAGRLVQEHRAVLQTAAENLRAQKGWEREDIPDLCQRLVELGLLGLGTLRSSWMLEHTSYLPHQAVDPQLLADLFLAVGLIERTTGASAIFSSDGTVEFRVDGRVLGSLILASGRGTKRWLSLEAAISERERIRTHSHPLPKWALVSGLQGGRPAPVSPPPSIVSDQDASNIISGYTGYAMFSVDELRRSPAVIKEIFA